MYVSTYTHIYIHIITYDLLRQVKRERFKYQNSIQFFGSTKVPFRWRHRPQKRKWSPPRAEPHFAWGESSICRPWLGTNYKWCFGSIVGALPKTHHSLQFNGHLHLNHPDMKMVYPNFGDHQGTPISSCCAKCMKRIKAINFFHGPMQKVVYFWPFLCCVKKSWVWVSSPC